MQVVARSVAEAVRFIRRGRRRFYVRKDIEAAVLKRLRYWSWINDSERDGESIVLLDLNRQIVDLAGGRIGAQVVPSS